MTEGEEAMERGMTADQVLSALWRRKILVGAIAAGIFLTGAAFVLAMPNVYAATVVVRVEPMRPDPQLVQYTVSELIEYRLRTVRQELLARPVLQRAIEEMKLYPELVEKHGIDAAVNTMRKSIDVMVEGESSFELTFKHEDPKVASEVANRLPTIFSEQTLKIRQEQAQRATQLFTEEMGRLKAAVTGWEKKIAQFKVDHIGELPEQFESNLRGLERITAQIQTRTDAMRSAEVRRSDMARATWALGSEAYRMTEAETALNRELVAAQTQWTADHPEVQRIQRELQSLTRERAAAEGRMVSEKQERARAAQMVTSIQKEIEALHEQAKVYQERLDRTPQWAHELGVLHRDYEVTKAKYESVVSRKVEAELAEELEAKSAQGMFNVISPAGIPTGAAEPDRFGGLMISLLLGLGVAVLAGVLLEMRDDSVRESSDVRERLPIPVLAAIPEMNPKALGKVERRVLTPKSGRNDLTLN